MKHLLYGFAILFLMIFVILKIEQKFGNEHDRVIKKTMRLAYVS